MIIVNQPNDGYRYEFTVVLPIDEEKYLFVKNFTNGFEAETCALSCGGIVIHNVRIAGKERINESN